MKTFIAIITGIMLFTCPVYAEITKELVVDRMEILEDGTIQVRTATRILENGKAISQSFTRKVITPGSDYSNEDAKVRAVADVVQTQAVKDKYKAK